MFARNVLNGKLYTYKKIFDIYENKYMKKIFFIECKSS